MKVHVELSVQQRNATTDSGQCWNKDYGKLNLKYNAVDLSNPAMAIQLFRC